MRSNNTFGIQIIIRHSKGENDDLATVFAQITVDRRCCESSLKNEVSLLDWGRH